MSVDDAAGWLDIDGLLVQLVLPKRDMDFVMLPTRTNQILQGGRDNE